MEATQEKESDSREAVVRRGCRSSLFRLGARLGPGLLLILALLLGGARPVAATNIIDYYLIGPAGAGGTVTVAASGAGTAAIGTSGGGTYYATAQTFIPYPGLLTQFTVTFGATTGSPTSTVSWAVLDNVDGNWGSVLDSGTFTPTASAQNTITAAGTAFLLNRSYWLRLVPTADQTAGNYWLVVVSTLNPYTLGNHATYFYKAPQIGINPPNDLVSSFTTVQGASPDAYSNDALAQAVTVASDLTISGVSLDLAKVGSPAGTLTYTLETDAGSHPSGVIVATATAAESGLATTYGPIAFTFSENINLEHGVRYWHEITTDRSSTTDYVKWGAAEFSPAATDFFVVHNQLSDIWIPQNAKGIYELTVVSGTLPATQEPDTQTYLTLDTGQAGRIDYTASGGEVTIALELFIILGVLAFILIMQITRRR